MNTRIALIAGLVSLLSVVAGCARPGVGPAASAPRPVVAYGVSAEPDAQTSAADRAARYEVAPVIQPHFEPIGFGGFGERSR